MDEGEGGGDREGRCGWGEVEVRRGRTLKEGESEKGLLGVPSVPPVTTAFARDSLPPSGGDTESPVRNPFALIINDRKAP